MIDRASTVDRPLLVVGILNVTKDSFFDGGRYLDPVAAIKHGERLAGDGAHVVEVGAASSHPGAANVPADVQIHRLTPVVRSLTNARRVISVDANEPSVQRWAAENGATFINDVNGFPDPEVCSELVALGCRLVVVYSVLATRDDVTEPAMDRVCKFFDGRITALTTRGVPADLIMIDPGAGLFLGPEPQDTLNVLRSLGRLKSDFHLPVMVSVSRKSFIQRLTRRTAAEAGAGTLGAELYAVAAGADAIRTHDPGALTDALRVWNALTIGLSRHVSST